MVVLEKECSSWGVFHYQPNRQKWKKIVTVFTKANEVPDQVADNFLFWMTRNKGITRKSIGNSSTEFFLNSKQKGNCAQLLLASTTKALLKANQFTNVQFCPSKPAQNTDLC